MRKKAPSPLTTPPLQSWVQDCMAEAPCLTMGARLTDLPNESYRALWAPSCASEKKAPTRKPPPTPNAMLFWCRRRRPDFFCKARRFCHNILDPTLQRGGRGGEGAFFSHYPVSAFQILYDLATSFSVWRRWSDSSGEHSCLSAPQDQALRCSF